MACPRLYCTDTSSRSKLRIPLPPLPLPIITMSDDGMNIDDGEYHVDFLSHCPTHLGPMQEGWCGGRDAVSKVRQVC